MLFKANLIKTNSSPAINLSLVGILCFFLSVFMWAFDALETIALFTTVAGLVMVVIGAVLSRNKPLYEVSKDMLVIDERSIQISEQAYQLHEVSNLQFYYDSYYCQSPFGYFTETSGLIEYGMNNTISFKSDGKDFIATFYLAESRTS